MLCFLRSEKGTFSGVREHGRAEAAACLHTSASSPQLKERKWRSTAAGVLNVRSVLTFDFQFALFRLWAWLWLSVGVTVLCMCARIHM